MTQIQVEVDLAEIINNVEKDDVLNILDLTTIDLAGILSGFTCAEIVVAIVSNHYGVDSRRVFTLLGMELKKEGTVQ